MVIKHDKNNENQNSQINVYKNVYCSFFKGYQQNSRLFTFLPETAVHFIFVNKALMVPDVSSLPCSRRITYRFSRLLITTLIRPLTRIPCTAPARQRRVTINTIIRRLDFISALSAFIRDRSLSSIPAFLTVGFTCKGFCSRSGLLTQDSQAFKSFACSLFEFPSKCSSSISR